jgi:ribosome-associated translation inhibitor RaiA
MEITQTLQVQTEARGAVPPNSMELAVEKVQAALRHASEPILFAKVKLTMSADPAVERPAVAQANVDLNGRLIRAQANAESMREAIDLMCGRVKIRLDRAARHWATVGGSKPVPLPDEWRHESAPARRLPYFPRPRDERAVIRHKSYAPTRETPDEAVTEMELLDYDFYLFTERATGQDSVLYRTYNGFVLVQAHPGHGDLGPVAASITVSDQLTPRIDTAAAIDRMEALGQPFLFFIDSDTGRGSLIYHRYDGHYGHITSAGTR